ncbi:MAG: pitrilysin family protein [Mariprofundales bacterium]
MCYKKWQIITCFIFVLLMPVTAQSMPDIQETRLDNGLRILLMEAHHLPMLSMRLLTPSGSRFDPNNHAGAASLLATMLGDHTKKHNRQAWARFLDDNALKLSLSVDQDVLALDITSLSDDSTLQVAAQAMSECLTQPGWNAKRFAILQQDLAASLQKSLESSSTRAYIATLEQLYGNHGYGHPSSGLANTVPNVSLADLQTIYKEQVRPDGAILAVSGDITLEQLVSLLQPVLKNWTGQVKHGLRDISIPSIKPVKAHDLHMPTAQTHLSLVRLGVSRGDKDFFPLYLLNHILGGGGFSSVLMEEVREKRGLAYGIYSWFAPWATTGPFIVSMQTRADQADLAYNVIEVTFDALRAGHIDAAKLRAAQNYLEGSFAQRLDSNKERVMLLAMMGMYKLPLDYLENWTKQMQSVSLQQVKKMADRFLNTSDWSLIRIGPKEKL